MDGGIIWHRSFYFFKLKKIVNLSFLQKLFQRMDFLSGLQNLIKELIVLIRFARITNGIT